MPQPKETISSSELEKYFLSQVYQRLKFLRTKVQEKPHLNTSEISGFIVDQHREGWYSRSQTNLYPIFTLPNPIPPTSYKNAIASLEFPVSGIIPSNETDLDTNVVHQAPSYLYFTVDRSQDICRVDKIYSNLTVFWKGVHFPGTHEAISYPIQTPNQYPFFENHALLLSRSNDHNPGKYPNILHCMIQLGLLKLPPTTLYNALAHYNP
jgi:hypothetical protein